MKKLQHRAGQLEKHTAGCFFSDWRTLFYALLPLLGLLFTVWYIKAASADVVYSDYIRLVDAYLPDVGNPAKFFVPDVFTRVPAAFLQRFLNVRLFGFSVTFDRLCTAAGLFLCAAVLARYAKRFQLSFFWYTAVMCLLFSLNKWEILLNGTAWAHVVTFGLFFLNYALFDRVYRNEVCLSDAAKRTGAFQSSDGGADDIGRAGASSLAFKHGADHIEHMRRLFWMLCLFPFVILLFAAEYIAAYAGVMTLACLFGIWMSKRAHAGDNKKAMRFRKSSASKRMAVQRDDAENGQRDKENRAACGGFLAVLICTLASFGIYLLSRHFAVWEHAGATSLSLGEVIAENPVFLPRFFIKTFAGAAIGQETIQNFYGNGKPLSDAAVLLLGCLVIGMYLLGIALYVKSRMYQRTLFPMILLLSGGMNHVIVTIGRWIFLKESYALSSRYSAQFMIGLIGIFLIFGLRRQCANLGNASFKQDALQTRHHRHSAYFGKIQIIVTVLTVFILAGNCYTTEQEIKKAPYREQNYEEMADMLRNSAAYTPEELCQKLDWHKSPDDLYQAITILRENHLNVFRR